MDGGLGSSVELVLMDGGLGSSVDVPTKAEKRDRRWPIPVMGVMELAGVRDCWALAWVLDRVVRTLVPPPGSVGVPAVMVA